VNLAVSWSDAAFSVNSVFGGAVPVSSENVCGLKLRSGNSVLPVQPSRNAPLPLGGWMGCDTVGYADIKGVSPRQLLQAR